MKEPIVVNSKTNIVLVGPILSKTGIIMSTPLNSPFINAVAHEIYKEGAGQENVYKVQRVDRYDRRFSFLWTHAYKVADRKNVFLLVVEGNLTPFLSDVPPQKMKEVVHEAILNASMEIGVYMTYENEKQETLFTNNGLAAYFSWEFSEVIATIENILE